MPYTEQYQVNFLEIRRIIIGKIVGDGITFDDVLLVPSYYTWLKEYRIGRARGYLTERDDMTICDIAEAVGYKSSVDRKSVV